MNTSDVVENTGHDAKGATGFEYQFLYFISQLLKMLEKQDSVSYERYDDVAYSTDDSLILFQLKHTIKGTVSKPVNLSLRDSDLWKTIAVWIDIVLKQEEDKKNDFIESSSFVLVTNKRDAGNEFQHNLLKFQSEEITYDEFMKYCQKVYDDTKEPMQKTGKPKKNSVKSYIKSLLDFKYAEQLLKSMTIHYEPDLKDKILDSLEKNKHIQKKHVEEAYQFLLGILKDKWFSEKKHSYTRDEFSKVMDKVCWKYRETRFSFRRNTVENLPTDLKSQVFIQQLMDVKDIVDGDDDDIVYYTNAKLDYTNNISEALKDYDVTRQDVDAVQNDAYHFWHDKYKFYIRPVDKHDEDKIIEGARMLLNDIRGQKIDFNGGQLENYFSNGCFYYLSDKDETHEPRIGWRPGWEEKYKSNG